MLNSNTHFITSSKSLYYLQEKFLLTFCGSKLNHIRFDVESKLKDVGYNIIVVGDYSFCMAYSLAGYNAQSRN